MKKVFVTGAAGFVASHLIPRLASTYQVTGLIKRSSEKKLVDQRAKVVVGDLAKKGPWQKSLGGHDVLIHLAAEISSKNPRDFVRNNIVATRNMVAAARRAKIKKIILFSSAAVTSIRRDPYADTKEEQEKIVKKSGIKNVILRPSMIYGPGDTKNIGWLAKTIQKLPIVPLPGGGNFGRQPVYVDDICKIVLKLIDKDFKKSVFEIHGREYISMARMVKVIVGQLNSPKPTIPVPLFLLTAFFRLAEKITKNPKFTSDQIKSLISGEKFHGDAWWDTFDIIPTSFEKGVSKMLAQK